MSAAEEPLVEAERKSEEARALIAKNEYDPAIELFAASLELRCVAPCHRAHRQNGALLARTPRQALHATIAQRPAHPNASTATAISTEFPRRARRIGVHGDQHTECAPAYCEYAKALLRKVQAESSPFGSAGPKPEPKATGDAAAGSSSSEGAAAAATAAAPDEGEACDDDEGGAGEAAGEEGEGEGEGEGEEEADDLELAFQCFEVARLAYEKAGADGPLADVHEFLGEVHLENSHWEDAIAEFEASLGIKQRLLSSDDRQLATLHFMLANAAVAEMEDRAQGKGDDPAAPGEAGSSSAPTPEAAAAAEERLRAQARKHYEAAADVLERKLGTLTADTDADEAADVREILAEMREKISEFSAAAPPLARAGGGSEGVTTIGFGGASSSSGSAGVTTIGFGAASGADSGSSSGFSAASSSALPVKCLGTVTTTNAAGRKKAVLVPLSTNSSEAAAPVSAKREAETAAEPAEADAKKAKVE